MTEKDARSNDSPSPKRAARGRRAAPQARSEPTTGTLLVRTAAVEAAGGAAEGGREPLPGIEVHVADMTAQTDERGELRLDLPTGVHPVSVVPPAGYEAPPEYAVRDPDGGGPGEVGSDAVPVRQKAVTEVEVTLYREFEHARKTGTVVGTVQSVAGTELPHVRVVLGVAAGGSELEIADTDQHGQFTFAHVKPGQYMVRLDEVPTVLSGTPWRPPPGDTGDRHVSVEAHKVSKADRILLEPVPVSGAITGFVLDLDGAAGLPGVSVELLPSGAAAPFATDADGHFAFPTVAPGNCTVRLAQLPAGYRLHPSDSGQRDVTVAPGQTQDVAPILLELVPVPPTGTIRGSVLNAQDAAGVQGIEVETEPVGSGLPLRQPTLADGTFSFAGLLPGDYRVGLRQVPAPAGGQLWQPQSPDKGERNITVAAGVVDVAAILVEPVTSSVTGAVRRVSDRSGAGGVQVTLRAADTDGPPLIATTNPAGEFEFANVRPGLYVLALAQIPVVLGNERLEPVLADPDEGRRVVRVPVNARVPVQPILLERERHRIFGTVRTSPGGPGAAFAELRVLDGRGNLLATLQADRNGDYEYRADTPGRYLIEVVRDGVRHVDTVDLQSDFPLDPIVQDRTIVGAQFTPTPDFAAFPVLTESVTLPQLPAPSGGQISSVGQTVESALREALGWRPRPNDPRGFSAALMHSFDRREVEGHTVATWTPRTYAAQVQADLGAITGAQASLYSRARVALDASLPLLDGLYPLDPAADPQDTEAIRAIIRSELTELVAELGVEGGPRISRVDDLLDLLLGRPEDRVQDTVGGQLGRLEVRFGLVRDRVETVDEEENLTNFIILVDYVREIDTSWRAQRDFFDPTSDATPFLGTQLVLLSRSLAVVAESVTEVGFTLDSVFLGAAERLAIRLTFNGAGGEGSRLVDSRNLELVLPARTPSILLGELLSWVERVASEEGPQLLQDGGKDGATALTPVLDKLRSLVRASLITTHGGLQTFESVPAGYATARVQRALTELAKYLDDSVDLASRIQR